MPPDKYFISYDWRAPRGTYLFCKHWSSNWLIPFLFKFVVLSFKYEIIDVQFRNYRE